VSAPLPALRAVWVLVDGVELPGLILSSSTRAATVRYVVAGDPGRGTAVETVTWDKVRPLGRVTGDGGYLE
jgi:hypothetical protein